MPSYTRGVLRNVLTFVQVTSAPLYYGFPTKDFAGIAGLGIRMADLIALGHTAPANLGANSLKTIGSRSPKPPIMSKIVNRNPGVNQQGKVSTFCGYNSIGTAEGEGWRLAVPGRSVNFSNRARTISMAAETTSGLHYIWPVNAADANNFKEILGLQDPGQMTGTERNRSISGTRYPRPPRVKIILEGGGSRTMFCSSARLDTALEAGWELVKGEIVYGGSQAPEGGG